jgi:hypothetical protein
MGDIWLLLAHAICSNAREQGVVLSWALYWRKLKK